MNNELQTKIKDIDFCGGDPGAAKYGNFINYYTFHDVQGRIDNLRPEIFSKPEDDCVVCLDIGCNSGNLTVKLYEYLRNIYVDCDIKLLAIDIDSTLIRRAKESNIYPEAINFSTIDIMNENDQNHILRYLESSRRKQFDITFSFSVLMWIHINNGDEGFFRFLNFLKDISKTVVIEPQPWKCYRNAQRRMIKSGNNFEHYGTLKIKSDLETVLENFFVKNEFKKIYESPLSSWSRKIITFKSLSSSVTDLQICRP